MLCCAALSMTPQAAGPDHRGAPLLATPPPPTLRLSPWWMSGFTSITHHPHPAPSTPETPTPPPTPTPPAPSHPHPQAHPSPPSMLPPTRMAPLPSAPYLMPPPPTPPPNPPPSPCLLGARPVEARSVQVHDAHAARRLAALRRQSKLQLSLLRLALPAVDAVTVLPRHAVWHLLFIVVSIPWLSQI